MDAKRLIDKIEDRCESIEQGVDRSYVLARIRIGDRDVNIRDVLPDFECQGVIIIPDM